MGARGKTSSVEVGDGSGVLLPGAAGAGHDYRKDGGSMSTMDGVPAAPVRGAVRVSERTRVGLGVVGAAVVLGVGGDVLLRSAPWGLNLVLWTAALVMTIGALQRWAEVDDVEVGWMPLAVAAAVLIAWRDSPTLKALDLAAL